MKNVKPLGLINSGAGGKSVDQNYAKAIGLKAQTLETPLQAKNMDGTENKWGTIKNYINIDAEINGRKIPIELLITGLGKERIILGFPWLNEYNPDINWRTGEFSWRKERRFFFNDKTLKLEELARKLLRPKPEETILKRENQLRTTVTKEEDGEKHLNST